MAEERCCQSQGSHRRSLVLPALAPESPVGPLPRTHLSHVPVITMPSAALSSRAPGRLLPLGGQELLAAALDQVCEADQNSNGVLFLLGRSCAWSCVPIFVEWDPHCSRVLSRALQGPLEAHVLPRTAAFLSEIASTFVPQGCCIC